MKYLKELNLENKETVKIITELIYANDKAGLEYNGSDIFSKIIDSLIVKFPHLTVKKLLEIIDNGAMGKYGVTYKFTPQLIGSWIYREKYLKAKTDAL